ncbi:MAG: hypothetical protein IKT68_07230 [Clostridia bacterium]|nr:hypothetical protein [Clostridia bacterium]
MHLKIKPGKKVLLLVVMAVLLVVSTVFGTLAWLTSETETITNTFTYGKVEITMDEAPVDSYGQVVEGDRRTTNDYKLVPGHTYTKDPTIHVGSESENCFVMVKIENQLGEDATFDLIDLPAEYSTNDQSVPWEEYTTVAEGNTKVYYLPVAVKPGAEVKVFEEFTFSTTVGSEDKPIANYEGLQIILTGYAIQAEGFTGDDGLVQIESAWGALNPLSE